MKTKKQTTKKPRDIFRPNHISYDLPIGRLFSRPAFKYGANGWSFVRPDSYLQSWGTKKEAVKAVYAMLQSECPDFLKPDEAR